jgi:DegV family protein with EDD domain
VDITPTETYKIFLEDPDSFNTSTASPEECLEVFRKVSQKTDKILCITVSSRLSTQYSAVRDACEMAKTELPSVFIEVIDSDTATPAEGMIALAAARAAMEGKEFPEVIKAAEDVKEKVHAIVFLETLRHVYRSGRIPKIASQLGSVLNIKPILTVNGVVHFAGMSGSRKSGIERMLHMMRKKTGDRPIHAAVTHAYAPEEAIKLKERIAEEFNCTELWLSEFSPVMGYACGTGTVGIAFYTEDEGEG